MRWEPVRHRTLSQSPFLTSAPAYPTLLRTFSQRRTGMKSRSIGIYQWQGPAPTGYVVNVTGTYRRKLSHDVANPLGVGRAGRLSLDRLRLQRLWKWIVNRFADHLDTLDQARAHPRTSRWPVREILTSSATPSPPHPPFPPTPPPPPPPLPPSLPPPSSARYRIGTRDMSGRCRDSPPLSSPLPPPRSRSSGCSRICGSR